MNRLSILFVSVLAGSIVVTATAQQTGVPAPATEARTERVDIPIIKADFPARPVVREWDALMQHKPEGKLTLVTVPQPGVRHTCRIASISEKELICKGKLGHTTAYRNDDVAALINPAVHDRLWPWVLGFLSAGGGAIAGACLVASVWGAVLLAILGAFFILATGPWDSGTTTHPRPSTTFVQAPCSVFSCATKFASSF
ncbi:MAG TPA: hypothetical protein VGN16_09960 [Acidobacteriaceae bacterium]|jgi:hypothetical protein